MASALSQILGGAGGNSSPGSEFSFQMPSLRTPNETPRFLQKLFARNVVPHFHEFRAMNPFYAAYEPNTLRMLPAGMDNQVF